METVTIECRCRECVHWKKKTYLKHSGSCYCQIEDWDGGLPKEDTDFCNYAEKKKNQEENL